MSNFMSNAFSFNMMPSGCDYALIRVKKVQPKDIPNDVISAVGHPDTAKVLSNILGREIACNRTNLTLQPEDVLYVAQYRGPRLPEGATVLPEGSTMDFLQVDYQDPPCRKGCSCGECAVCGMLDWVCGH